ncbi:MAG TPA: Uma2 family endonuclease [Thermoanaerobaculia bacterium]|nr:Uma2 family endonuclease [Thermoanaerobaculia bacterium]
MAEPARKRPARDEWILDDDDFLDLQDDGEPGISVLQRWIEGPDGEMVLWETPLTPELFLDPQLEDKIIQGNPHFLAVSYLHELLSRRFHDQPDVLVLSDLKHLLGPGLPSPAPDISILRDPHHPDPDELMVYDLVRYKTPPFFVLEVVSPSNPRVRRIDEVTKVRVYERIGVEEYLLVDLPRRATGHRFRLRGYRLDQAGHYQAIEPDAEGRLLARTLDFWFTVSDDGKRVLLVDATTGEVLLTPIEEVERRKVAEAELARLQAEIERLRRSEGG